GKNLKLGMHHQQLACVTIQLDLSEQRELQPNREAVGKICAMKPLTHEANRRAVAENNFEKAKVSAAKCGKLRRMHFHQHRGHFSGRQLGNRLQIAAVLVTEWSIREQIFHGKKTFGLQHRRAGRPNSFYVLKRSREVELTH